MSVSVSMEDFETLLNESLELETPKEGSVVKGKVIAIEAGQAIIDIGYKMEGRVDERFSIPGQEPDVALNDVVEVYLKRLKTQKAKQL